MKKITLFGIALIALGLRTTQPVSAQQIREGFGKNRIQYKTFNWQYISAKNFNIYYYGDGLTVAKQAADYLQSQLENEIKNLTGFTPVEKFKLFLYQSKSDWQQSNADLNNRSVVSADEVKSTKSFVEIAHLGTAQEFKEELVYRASELLIKQVVFGGSLRDVFQNAVFLNLPDWFIAGAASYAAYGWSAEMDDYIRQTLRNRSPKSILHLSGREAALIGQSIWNFVAQRYGKSVISSILNYTRVMRSERRGIQTTLNTSFDKFIQDWSRFYLDEDEALKDQYIMPNDSNRFFKSKVNLTSLRLNTNGKYLAYATNDRGRFTVHVRSVDTGKEIKITSGGNRVKEQQWADRLPLLSWADDHTLGVISIKKGNPVFWLYDLQQHTKTSRSLARFSNVKSFSFSQNGKLVVMSADEKGQNNLYLMSLRRDLIRKLTNDTYDDLDPFFIPNTNRIVFSSNRALQDKVFDTNNYRRLNIFFNLYSFDLDESQKAPEQFTKTLGKDTRPIAIDADNFLYISNQRGIGNIFKYTLSTKTYLQITNFNTSVCDYDYSPETEQMALVMKKGMADQIYLITNAAKEQRFTLPTRRMQSIQLLRAAERKAKKADAPTVPDAAISVKEIIQERLKKKSPADTIPQSATKPTKTTPPVENPINTSEYTFEDAPAPKKTSPVTKPTGDGKPISTEQYGFETPLGGVAVANAISKFIPPQKLQGPYPYKPHFTYDNLAVSLGQDPLRGLFTGLQIQTNDLLENFRLLGGFHVKLTDFKSGDLFAEFQYLPKRIDYGMRFDKRVYLWNTPNQETTNLYLETYSYNKLEFSASLPITERFRVSGKLFGSYTRFIDRGGSYMLSGLSKYRAPVTQFYAGIKLEAVYDNTVTSALNLPEGFVAKLFFTNYQAIHNVKKGFSQLFLDIRHYLKIFNGITLAIRGVSGTYFGSSPKNYVLGGVDTQFFSKINYEGQNNPLTAPLGQYNEQLLFLDFNTNLRGFPLAMLYGNSVLLGTAELRIPFVKMLTRRAISSHFLKNMQFIGFYDIGTAWSGEPPFLGGKSARTRLVPEDNSTSPFKIEINEFTNPWIYSFGGGLRISLLGHFIWANVAWPTENFVTKKPVYSLGIGLDF